MTTYSPSAHFKSAFEEEVLGSVGELTAALRAIAHGGIEGPGGLEALAVAVAGRGLERPLSVAVESALLAIADAVRDGLTEVADATRTNR